MTQRTTDDDQLSRDEFAAYLRELAAEFEEGDEHIPLPVGNKDVTLTPPETFGVSVEVVERSSVLRGDRETVDIELSWKR